MTIPGPKQPRTNEIVAIAGGGRQLPLSERLARICCLLLDVDGVLTDGHLYYTAGGEEMKAFHVRDGSALKLWRMSGGRTAIVSGRSSTAVERRARELDVDILLQGVTDKVSGLAEVCRQLMLEEAKVCAIGDDWLDLPLLRRVGVAAAPADATAEVRQCVDYVTLSCGGKGAVRDVVEWVLRGQGKWAKLLELGITSTDSSRKVDHADENKMEET